MKKVAVGSKNPVKVEAVRLAFQAIWPDEKWIVEGVSVESGISDQPMSDDECISGAGNRARRSIDVLKSDFGVGLEGGIQKIGKHFFVCGWIVVVDQSENEGIGSTIKIIVPEKMIQLIQEGKELGDVCDIIFGGENTKQAEGHFGLMTNNAVTRTSGYRDGIISALASFVHPHLSG